MRSTGELYSRRYCIVYMDCVHLCACSMTWRAQREKKIKSRALVSNYECASGPSVKF